MKKGQLVLDIDDRVVVPRLMVARGSVERIRGLLGRPALEQGDGMFIKPCNSVHTFGMRYPIDVVFLGRSNKLLKIVPALKPLRMSSCLRASAVLELAAGEAERLDLNPGMTLALIYGAEA